MAWTSIFETEEKSRSYTASDVFGARTSDSAAIDYVREGYEQNPYIYRAVNLISSAVAELDVDVYTEAEDSREKVEGHPVSDLLARPNPLRAKAAWMERLVTHLLLSGEVYVEAIGPDNGAPQELYIPDPTRIDPYANATADGLIDFYRDSEAGEQWSPDEMHMIRLVNPRNPFKGQSLLKAAAGAGDVNNYCRRYSRALLKASGVPPYLITTEAELGPEGEESLERKWTDKVRSSFQAMLHDGRPEPHVMDNMEMADLEQLGFNPKEMQLLKQTQQSAREIAVAMGPAPELLGDPENKVYNNMEAAREALYTEDAMPLARLIAGELEQFLFPQYDSLPDGAMGINDSVPALQPDPEKKRQQDLEELKEGAITINEYRERQGMEPVEEGDVLLVPQSKVPLTGAQATSDE